MCDAVTDQRRKTRECAQMQILGHERPVVHGVVVPQGNLAPKPDLDIVQMRDPYFGRTHFLTSPVDSVGGVERLSKCFEVPMRSCVEDPVEDRIVRVITRTEKDAASVAVPADESGNFCLSFGQIGDIAAHIVEQNC